MRSSGRELDTYMGGRHRCTRPCSDVRCILPSAGVVVLVFVGFFVLPLQHSMLAASVCATGSTAVPPNAPSIAFVASLKHMGSLDASDATFVHQANAIGSWRAAGRDNEVFVVGDASAEAAAELWHVHFLDGVKVSAGGVPLLNDMIHRVKAATKLPLIAFVNADIVFGPSFAPAMDGICRTFTAGVEFLATGRRIDTTLDVLLDFDSPQGYWRSQLETAVASPGAYLQNELYKDYFIFSRGLWEDSDIPPLAVGRAVVDDWIVKSAVLRGRAVDITSAKAAVHQNHSYHHVTGGQTAAWTGDDAVANRAAAGDVSALADVQRCTYEVIAPREPDGVYRVRRRWWGFAVLALYHLRVVGAHRWTTLPVLGSGAVLALAVWKVSKTPKLRAVCRRRGRAGSGNPRVPV